MPDPAIATDGAAEGGQVSIRRYTGTPPEMRQPAMCENLICMHLGGAKEVRRWYDGRMDVHSVDLGAMTIMPAHQSNRWLTRGPIDFAHLMLSPELLSQFALEEFERSPHGFHLTDSVGFRDPHLEALFAALLSAIENRAGAGRLYPDSLLVVLIVHLLSHHSTLARPQSLTPLSSVPARGGLAPWRLRRVLDYMREGMGADMGLTELTALTGLSRAQFFRAFKQSTGLTPHRYLTALRLDAARALLHQRDLEISEVGVAVGLPGQARFAALFRQRFGLSPKACRASMV